jgi:predicted PP-loop superfamily ATPase
MNIEEVILQLVRDTGDIKAGVVRTEGKVDALGVRFDEHIDKEKLEKERSINWKQVVVGGLLSSGLLVAMFEGVRTLWTR